MPAEIDDLEALVVSSAAKTIAELQQLFSGSALSSLAALRFQPMGCDPLDTSRALNLVEQLNQSFTYLATFEAARWLLARHPEHVPLTLRLGTTRGTDISSSDGAIAAETFAATQPNSNDKVRKDALRLKENPARHRYVFYLSPVGSNTEVDGVKVIRLEHASVGRAGRMMEE